MKRYVVVYIVEGIYYRFRCYATSKNSAKTECVNAMGVPRKCIDDVYEE